MSVHPDERREALHILQRIRKEGAYSSILLEKTFNANKDWEERSKAFITNLVYLVLMKDRRIESLIDRYSKVPYRKLDETVALILEISVAQSVFMDRVPDFSVVNEAVKLTRAEGKAYLSRFVNAVLRSMMRDAFRESWPERKEDPIAHYAVAYCVPDWIMKLWVDSYGLDRAVQIAKNLNRPRGISLRVNTMKTDAATLCQMLSGPKLDPEKIHPGQYLPEAISIEKGALASNKLFSQGYFTIQDESSMLSVRLLDPRPGEKILDLCAAPGGKSTHIAERMQDRGYVSARDVHEHKIKLIMQNAKRLGLTAVHPELGDAMKKNPKDVEAWDRVLLDAPCSGLGVLRTKPDLKLHASQEKLQELATVQRQMLEIASTYVRPGGVLVYSTCTLDPMENEEQIFAFLQKHPEYRMEAASEVLPSSVPAELTEKSYVYVWPKENALDGFFMCRLRRS